MEELSELQKEVSKCIRCKGNRANLIEEMADVYICLEMLREMHGVMDQELQFMIERKEKRNRERLKYGGF